MDYELKTDQADKTYSFAAAAKSIVPLLADQKGNIAIALSCVVVTSAANLLSPGLIARVVDTAIPHHDYGLLLRYGAGLLGVYVLGLFTAYFQTLRMGRVGRNVLYKLRNGLFLKLSNLPIAFFAQNRIGDLISRVNNDTDKLNQFFSQALMQFFGNFFLMFGSGILLLTLHFKLGLIALAPAVVILILSRALSPWITRVNRKGLESLGGLSGEINESLANFKVIVAFNRLDYFRAKFDAANQRNYRASITSGVASSLFTPLYTLAANAAQILVLGYGISQVLHGTLSIGLLIGYLLYVTSFYNPLRQLATVWASYQLAVAALDRVSEVLDLESDLRAPPTDVAGGAGAVLAFEGVSFAYRGGKLVLDKVDLKLERGKTYALVGPTGGGKTTTAMLMARLYDPVEGRVFLEGRDIRAWGADERAAKIGYILQEPFLFTGTVGDNIAYGNPALESLSLEDLLERLKARKLSAFVERFNDGLATKVTAGGDVLSLGQKQLVAFMRAVLREPDILILDEATANIDTVTEQMLEEVLAQLPSTTTKVIIAHRLNTIQDADDIFFVGGGALTEAGSMQAALDMLMSSKRAS